MPVFHQNTRIRKSTSYIMTWIYLAVPQAFCPNRVQFSTTSSCGWWKPNTPFEILSWVPYLKTVFWGAFCAIMGGGMGEITPFQPYHVVFINVGPMILNIAVMDNQRQSFFPFSLIVKQVRSNLICINVTYHK